MKKIIATVAIVCAAIGTHAAQITWGNTTSSSIYDLDGATKLTKAVASSYNLTVSLVDASGKTAQTISGISSMAAGVMQQAAYTYKFDTDYTTGDTFTILAKMTVGGKNYTMTITPAVNTITAVNNTGIDEFSWTSGTYGGLQGTSTAGTAGSWVLAEDPEPTPEPTSALMLLLGMAGLALRRKQA